jgi:integrase
VNWGISEGYISDDPLKTLQKPPVKSRKRVLTADERKAILDTAKEPFRTFLWALFESGARPGEVARVSAAEFHGDVWVFEKHKTAKRTGRDRIVYLTPELSELCKKLAAERPEGSLFRNRYGLAWSRNAIRIRLRNLRRKLNLQGVVAYTARHSFCTDGLERGVPIATMAELLGHSSTRMISQHYNHLAQRTEHLKRAAMQARGVVAGNGSSE